MDAVIVGPGTTAIDQPNLSFDFDSFDLKYLEVFSRYKKLLLKQTKFFYELDKNFYDEFLRGMLIFYREIVLSTKFFNYQPVRIFILGRYFKNFKNFYKKQMEITKRTQQKFFFLVQNKYKQFYQDFLEMKDTIIECPDIQKKQFFSFLNEFLVQQNIQKVLIETGARFFYQIYPYLEKEDPIYLIQKQNIFLSYQKEIIKKYLFWDQSEYHFVLKDSILLEDFIIYSLRKA